MIATQFPTLTLLRTNPSPTAGPTGSPDRPLDHRKLDHEVERVAREHEALTDDLMALHLYVAGHVGSPASWLDGLIARLETLGDALLAHFALEERTGIYRSIPVAAPQLGLRVADLRFEHLETLVQLETLRDDCVELGLDLSYREIARRTETLVDFLHRHERRESELMRACFGDAGEV